jgi:predicted oxidoreductase
VIIHLGTNDNSTHNNVTNERFERTYVDFVGKIHTIWPKANVVIVSLANGFWLDPQTRRWHQSGAFVEETVNVWKRFEKEGWLHYFNASGVLVSRAFCVVY